MTPAQRLDAIRPLAAKQLSAGDIACHFANTTRNAIIGVCMRNGIAFGIPRSARQARTAVPTPYKAPRAAKREAAPKSEPAAIAASIPQIVEPAPTATPVLFMEAKEHHCRWPLWPDRGRPLAAEMFVCGAAPISGKPYCPYHTNEARGDGTPSERAAVRSALAVKS